MPDMVQLHLIIGFFWRQLSAGIQFLIGIVALLCLHFCFQNQPHIMSSNTEASILDDALACIGQRITSILIQPANNDQNYIASLHNEVVRIS